MSDRPSSLFPSIVEGPPRVFGVAGPPAPVRAAMHHALALARAAARAGEVPVGAVVLDETGRTIAAAANATARDNDPSAHAELLAFRAAIAARDGRRLDRCTLVVTLEPCAMCAGAAVHFRVGRIVFGAYDPKGGAVEHGARLFHQPGCLHHPELIGGYAEAEAGALLRAFFAERR